MPKEKWIFTKENIEKTPSRNDLITLEDEASFRNRSCEFIVAMTSELQNVTVLSICTACMYFHRFYMFHSFSDIKIDRFVVATTCLFLACKTNENSKKLDKIIKVSMSVQDEKVKSLASLSQKELYEKRKQYRLEVLKMERIVAHTLDFDLRIDFPYKHIYRIVRNQGISSKKVLTTASTLLNDTYKHMICILYEPIYLASASLILALLHCKESFPSKWHIPRNKLEQFIDVAKEILKSYYPKSPIEADLTPFEKILENCKENKSIALLEELDKMKS
mmetsp:Transcript_921/g.1445  ORF Transcript_921/g.1445 Transcript_921/m.1445 type:complete len:277 (-) Transcript_921:41-871(-)